MSWRKWIVRCLVFGIAGVCASAGYLYRYWTNPAAVREHVIAFLKAHCPGAVIALDGAHISLLGGIVLNDLRLARRDDPNQVEFLHVPSATIYHDKEKLLDGILCIRRMELDHLHLRIVRERDGRWNLADVIQLAQPDVPVPTCVIHDATLVLEDRLEGANLVGVEIHHVNLQFINDPVAIVHVDGRAHSELLGDLEVHGTRNRRTGEIALSLQVQGVTITPGLLQRIAARCPSGRLDKLRLEGQADFLADIAYLPECKPAFSYRVNGRLRHGMVHHPSLPIPLEDMDAHFCCQDGKVQLREFKAKSGTAEVWARGWGLLPCPDGNFEGAMTIKHLQLRSELFEKLPLQFRKLHKQFSPEGPVTLCAECARRGGDWVKLATGGDSIVTLQPEDIAAKFDKFPYPLQRLSGALKLHLASGRIDVDITAYAGARPVLIKGNWQGKENQASGSIDIQANEIPLDAKLLEALRGRQFYDLARSFHARGKADIKALVRHVPGVPAGIFANEYHIHFHDADINWQEFPYPLTAVSGMLDIYPHWMRFYDFQGRHEGGTILVEGGTTPDNEAAGAIPRLIIGITGKNVPLDADLQRAMKAHPTLFKTWEMFAPSGRTDFTASIDRLKGPAPEPEVLEDMSVSVDVRGGVIQPLFFPYAISDLATRFNYHRHKVNLAHLSGQHGTTQISLGASLVDLHAPPQGGFYADLKQLRARELKADADFLEALRKAPSLKAACTALDLKDPVMLQTDLRIAVGPEPGAEPDIYWDGQLWLKRARLRTGLELSNVTGTLASRGRHRCDPHRGRLLELIGNFRLDQAVLLKQPFHDVQGSLQVLDKEPEVLALGIKAPVFGGDVSGQVRIEVNKSKTRYNLNLTASQIDLQEFGRHNLGDESKLRGQAGGRLVLSGLDSGIDSLDGYGQIEIPRGHIYPYNLPLLIDLLKLLALRAPDRTMFDEANAFFRINGQNVHVDRLELLGNAVSLYGRGDFKHDGTDVKLDFYPSWGRVEQLMPEVLRSIPAEIGKQMLKIEMRGQVGANPGDLRLTKRPVPIVTDPLLHVWGKMIGSK
jgi:hypothetical protein